MQKVQISLQETTREVVSEAEDDQEVAEEEAAILTLMAETIAEEDEEVQEGEEEGKAEADRDQQLQTQQMNDSQHITDFTFHPWTKSALWKLILIHFFSHFSIICLLILHFSLTLIPMSHPIVCNSTLLLVVVHCEQAEHKGSKSTIFFPVAPLVATSCSGVWWLWTELCTVYHLFLLLSS